MIALVEGAERQKTPNEIALNILLAGLTIVFLLAVVTLQPFAIYSGAPQSMFVLVSLLVCLIPTTIGGLLSAIGIAGHGPAGAAQRAGDVGPRGRGRRRRAHAAARQDRHDHLRQPPGDRVRPAARASPKRSSPTRRSCPRSPTRRRKAARSSCWPRRSTASAAASSRRQARDVRALHGADAHVGRRLRRPRDPQRRRRRRSSRLRARRSGGAASRRSSRTIVERIARAGGTPLVVAEGERALGVIHLKDIVKGGMRERFAELRAMGIRTVMITGDNPLTAAAIAAGGGRRRLPRRRPRPKTRWRSSRRSSGSGKLVAMTGDGTNDAPALAQADVGVAMNTGTQAAKEAGNMVDLDSNPTKLIEIVEIGKQLLMTRGALTTFSIANDVAKYFAIIPAMFAGGVPGAVAR